MIPTQLQKYGEKQPVLNGEGFVRLIDVMGDDGSIVEAARVTTGKGRSSHKWSAEVVGAPGLPWPDATCTVCGADAFDTGPCLEGDRRLLSYMLAHNHASPFEFAEFVVHVRCPVYVFRQWVRHWSWSFQEYSMRYSDAIDAMHTTPPDAWRAQASSNRQGSAGLVTAWPVGWSAHAEDGETVVRGPGVTYRFGGPNDYDNPGGYLSVREAELHALARDVYEERLAFGVAREQARKDLPLSNMTEVYCKANLRDLLHFLYLRTDGHAQQEIREYADVIAKIVEAWCPLTWGAFVEHRRDAVTFSATEARALRDLLRDIATDTDDAAYTKPAELLASFGEKALGFLSKGTARERAEFLAKLGLS